MNKLLKFFFVIMVVVSVYFISDSEKTLAADSPYDVSSTVKNNWDNIYGGKMFSMSSGKNLVYDIYSEKFNKNGYSIVTRDFGKGSQKYIRFQGWSILFGHYRHTSTNQETYIVAEDRSNFNIKIYSTLHYGNLSASEDVEYGKDNSTPTTLYKECSPTTTNKTNYVPDGGCNMRYDDVGFDAYLPIEELFSDITKAKSYNLYIVKHVNSHLVYTPLYIPFDFNTLSYEGGDIDLSSGVNARQLIMNSTNVFARTAPKGNTSLGYFSEGGSYTAVDQDESGTAIWFGVKYGNKTGWASSAYWTFGGDQAVLSFKPDDKPPVHISDSLEGTYQNGKVTWVQPNQTATATLRQQDVDSGNQRQYIGFDDGTTNVRSSHSFTDSSATNISHHITSKDISINSAKRLENTTYGKVEWKVTPKVHGTSYDLKYYYSDRAGNTIGYLDTGRDLKVDGVAPSNKQSTITGATYVKGTDYWVKSGTPLTVTLSQYDPHSGNQRQYIRLLDKDGNIVARSRHDFSNTSNSFKENEIVNNNVEITAANRKSNTSTGTLDWTIVPKKSGEVYKVQYYYRDNVGNNYGYIDVGTIRVDDDAPTNETASITGAKYVKDSTYWVNSNDALKVTLRQYDPLSGNKYQYIRLLDEKGTIVVRNRHDFANSSNTSHNLQITNENVAIPTVNRTENTSYGKVEWTVIPKVNNSTYTLQRNYYDNVNNTTDYITVGKIATDDDAPTVSFRNEADTADLNSSTKPVKSVKVRLKFNDSRSGYNKSRYGWSTSKTKAPTTWSNWTTSNNYVVEQTKSGRWYLHVQAVDNVGNATKGNATNSVIGGEYVVNTAPKVVITLADVHYIGDTIHVINESYDVDGDELTYTYTVTKPDGTVEVITSDDPRMDEEGDLFIKADQHPKDLGIWTFTLEAADQIETSSATISTVVLDQVVEGTVNHTEQWLKNIEKFNVRYPSMALNLDESSGLKEFITGERFILNAEAQSNAVSVNVSLKEYATRFDESILTQNGETSWNGDLWHENMVEVFKDDEVLTFEFTATFSNGWIDVDEVQVKIKEEAYWRQHTAY